VGKQFLVEEPNIGLRGARNGANLIAGLKIPEHAGRVGHTHLNPLITLAPKRHLRASV
jgi:hypothetical protein